MADNAIDRTSRALDLSPYIVEHPGITIEELSDAFGASESEISQILNIVFMCGLPGYSHLELIDLSTENGYVSIIDPQNLSKPRKLTKVEVISILLGLENLSAQGVTSDVAILIDSVSEKMKTLLGDIDTLALIEGERAITPSPWKLLLEASIREKSAVEISYLSLSNERQSTRVIGPRRIYLQSGLYYVEAYCDLAKGLRHFRLDRISSASKVNVALPPFVETFVEQNFEVDVLLPAGSRYFLESNAQIIRESEMIGDEIRVKFEVASMAWLFRALSALDGRVTILAPESLNAQFKELNAMTLANYTSS